MSSLLGGLIQRKLRGNRQNIDFSGDTTFQGSITIQSEGSSSDSTSVLAQSTLSILTDTSGYSRVITKTVGVLEIEGIYVPSLGALDSLDASLYTDAVGAYGTRRIFEVYTGPQITIRRSSDNVEADIYFDRIGNPTKLIVVSTQEEILDPSIETWLGSATAYVKTWYDQSANAKHLVQTTTTSQPVLKHDPAMCGYVVYVSSALWLSAPVLFSASSIVDMQGMFKMREIVANTGINFSFRGITAAFSMYAPYNDASRRFYWDAGDNSTNRTISSNNIVPFGQTARIAFSKSSATNQNRLIVNGSVSIGQNGFTSTTSDRFRIGGMENTPTHHVQYFLVYSAEKTEALVSDAFSKMDISECPRESPQFTANSGTNNIASDYNSKYGWDTDQGWVASASSTFDTNRAAWKAFNKTIRADSFDRWLSASGAIDANGNVVGEEWIRMDFPEPVIITQYSLSAFWVSTQVQTPIRWMLEAYDGSAWIGIGDEVSASTPWTSAEQTFIPSKQTFASSSWRLNIFEALPTDGGLISISELKFHTKKTVA